MLSEKYAEFAQFYLVFFLLFLTMEMLAVFQPFNYWCQILEEIHQFQNFAYFENIPKIIKILNQKKHFF